MTRGLHTRAQAVFNPGAADVEADSPLARQRPCANVLGISVEALDLERALSHVSEFLRLDRRGYVCAVGVHGILESRRDPSLAQAFAEAAIVVPDGMPTVWVGRIQGLRDMRHVTGPDLMLQIFNRVEFASYSHFFYGGKEGVADQLAATMQKQFPWIRVAGTYTPPFRDLTMREEADLIGTINKCKPDMIWVGISTPRQELFMRRMLPHFHTRLMFGVGAAFDFHTGRIRNCAEWIKVAGFQWLHRLLQDPKRLWRRNLRNSAFLWHITLQLTGLRKYDANKPVTAGRPTPLPMASKLGSPQYARPSQISTGT